MIVDSGGKEVVRAGKFFGGGMTNNEAESLALKEAMDCLLEARQQEARWGWALDAPVRVFGDS